MKFSISSILPSLLWVFPLLMCALISLLYACDFISTTLFALASRINGCLFAVMLGFILGKVMKKRQFLIALLLSIVLTIVHFSIFSDLNEHLFFGLKLILFNTIVLIKVFHQPQSR